MSRRVRCKLCHELTANTTEAYVTPLNALGVAVPGAKTKVWLVCDACAQLLEDS